MFRFHDKNRILANAKWAFECNNNPGGPAGVINAGMLVDAKEAEINFGRCQVWSNKHSFTAKRLLNEVKKSPVVINVVAWRSSNPSQPGFTMFASDSPIDGQGTVFINLEAIARVAQLETFSAGGRIAMVPGGTGKNVTLNSFVVMLHEIGHAKQFVDNPAWFRRNETTKNHMQPQFNAMQEVLIHQSNKSWVREDKVLRALGDAHKKFSSAIEYENYLYHEGPICDEIGVARRGSYENVNIGFGDTSMTGDVG
jgi:hypothetical protein